MKVNVISEQGYEIALFGNGLSYGITSHFENFHEFEVSRMVKSGSSSGVMDKMAGVCRKLANKDGGHNKFLEMMTVWLDIDAPRYWWSEFDTYRVGTSKLSESTMHTITKRHLSKADFEGGLDEGIIAHINAAIDTGDFHLVKRILPESFLQRRVVCTNYKVLRNMYQQRKNHRLPEWHEFCGSLKRELEHFEFIENYGD